MDTDATTRASLGSPEARAARPRVLVTDGDTRAALAITRSLGRRGVAVLVAAPRRRSLAAGSRYCESEHLQAAQDEGPEALKRSLEELFRRLAPDRILAVTDRTMTALQELRGILAPHVVPPPSAAQYFEASDKVALHETCRRIGIPVPRGIAIAGGAIPDHAAVASLGPPWVVRPSLSWRADGSRWVAGRVSVEHKLEAVADRVRHDAALSFPYLIQEKIEGEGCGLFVLSEGGRAVNVFAHRRLREKPPTGGVSTLCESVAPPADLLDAAQAYLRDRHFSGLAMFEFKRARDTGLAQLLEINARPWGSMALAEAAGVDFIGNLLDLVPSETRAADSYRTGIRLRWWWGDVDHYYLREVAAGRSTPLALARALYRAVRCGPWAEAWDTFQRDDPIPFGLETLAWLRR